MEKTTTLIKNRYTLAEEHTGLENTYIPPRGCTVIYPAEGGYQKVKLGDGVTTLAELPWCGNESDLDAILEEAKAYTDNEIATFDFIKVVNVLPETGLLNKIYLVPNTANTENNLFDEWIWINKGTESTPEYAWEWITTKQVEVDLSAYATKEYVDTNKMQVVTTTGTGSAYTATVPGITELTPGVSFVMIPHVESSSPTPTLNVNSLGAVGLRRQSSIVTSSAQTGYNLYWLAANYPITVMYNGTCWIVKDLVKPSASDLIGTVAVSMGGTGKSTLTSNAILAGNGTGAVKMITTASGALYATTGNGAAQFGTLPIAQGGTGATTATDVINNLKSQLLDLIYPVGSCNFVTQRDDGIDPNTLYGGLWQERDTNRTYSVTTTKVYTLSTGRYPIMTLSEIVNLLTAAYSSRVIGSPGWAELGVSICNGDGAANSGVVTGCEWIGETLYIHHTMAAGSARFNMTFSVERPDPLIHWHRTV